MSRTNVAFLLVSTVIVFAVSLYTSYRRSEARRGAATIVAAAPLTIQVSAPSSPQPQRPAAQVGEAEAMPTPPLERTSSAPLPELIGVLLHSEADQTLAYLRFPSGVVRSAATQDELEDGLFLTEINLDHVIVFQEPDGFQRLDLVLGSGGSSASSGMTAAATQAYMQAPVPARAAPPADNYTARMAATSNFGGGRQGTIAKLQAMRATIP
jgi:hypothetical protein